MATLSSWVKQKYIHLHNGFIQCFLDESNEKVKKTVTHILSYHFVSAYSMIGLDLLVRGC